MIDRGVALGRAAAAIAPRGQDAGHRAELRQVLGIVPFVELVLLLRRNIALGARSRRDHREPDHTLVGPFFLQPLHVAALVMLLSERTSIVVPFENHKLTFVIG